MGHNSEKEVLTMFPLVELVNLHEMIFDFFTTSFYTFTNEYLYFEPWYQINEATIAYIRYFDMTLLPKRCFSCEYAF